MNKEILQVINELIEKLQNELDYEEKKLEVCGYGKRELYQIEHLKYQIKVLEELGEGL